MTRKNREIGKRLAVISICAKRDKGMNIDTMNCILEQTAYIAEKIGGVKMMEMIKDAVCRY